MVASVPLSKRNNFFVIFGLKSPSLHFFSYFFLIKCYSIRSRFFFLMF